jgi:FecR protein
MRGGSVSVGDVINTGRNGRAVLVRGEEYLVVAPNSRIRVADPAKSGGFTQIVEHFGNVIYKIKKMTMPHFAVETPFLAAVVKGTTFSVTVTEKGASVQVIEGKVEVATRDGGATFMVLPGDIGSVSATAPGSLNVQGRESKTINSPTPAAAAAAVTASVEDNAVAPPDQVQFSGVIETPVSEGPVNLGAMSDGMVQGDSAMTAIASLTKVAVIEAQKPPPAAAETVTNVVTASAVVVVEPTPVALPPVVADVPAPVVAAPPVVVAALPPAPLPEPVEVAALPPTPAPPVVAALPVPAPALVAIVAALPAAVPGNGNNSGPGNSNSFGQNGSGNGNNGNGNGNNANGNSNSGNGSGNSGPGNGHNQED